MTRDCPTPAYLFSSIPAFFPRRDILPGGLEVFSCLHSSPFRFCVSLVDLEQLGTALQISDQRKNIINLLAPDEKKIFASFSYPKRKTEWLGGRIAGKSAAFLLLEGKIPTDRLPTIAIKARKNGSPELSHDAHPGRLPSVSISHSAKLAVGMASHSGVCGIDIQKITDQTEKVVSRFAESEEISLLNDTVPDLNRTQRLSLLWAAKEALKKALLRDQPVIFQGVTLKDVRIDGLIALYLQLPGNAPLPAKVDAVVLGEYILAFSIPSATHA